MIYKSILNYTLPRLETLVRLKTERNLEIWQRQCTIALSTQNIDCTYFFDSKEIRDALTKKKLCAFCNSRNEISIRPLKEALAISPPLLT